MKTTSIKFFWNGIKINGSRSLIKCYYSLDNNKAHSPTVRIYADGYGSQLPADLFTVHNETDLYTDYFDTDSTILTPEHPLYKYARYAAERAEARYLPRQIQRIEKQLSESPRYYSGERGDYYWKEIEQKKARLAELNSHKDPGHPTAADLAAVEAMNTAAESARLAAEKEAEQKAREKVLNQRNNGRRFIEQTAADHPISEGAPAVTIRWSENPAFYDFNDKGGVRLSVAAAEIILKHYDEEKAAENGGYDKTDFLVEFTDQNGEQNTYEGRYDLGDNDGGLIAHIRTEGESLREHGMYFNDRPTEQDKQTGAEIVALADLLEQYTDGGKIIAVTVAPWLEKALEERKKAEQRKFSDLLEALDMLTDEQLASAVMLVPNDGQESLDVARFLLQKLAVRDEKKALEVFRRWKDKGAA